MLCPSSAAMIRAKEESSLRPTVKISHVALLFLAMFVVFPYLLPGTTTTAASALYDNPILWYLYLPGLCKLVQLWQKGKTGVLDRYFVVCAVI